MHGTAVDGAASYSEVAGATTATAGEDTEDRVEEQRLNQCVTEGVGIMWENTRQAGQEHRLAGVVASDSSGNLPRLRPRSG